MKKMIQKILDEYISLSEKCDVLNFSEPVEFTYNPLKYAWSGFECYIKKFINENNNIKFIFLGMNPGPWGMAQTGVPFGEISAVKNWLGIKNIKISKPKIEHEKYLVEGLDCKRSEISGKRLWGLFQERYKTSENFFKENFVLNYCPLLFISKGTKINNWRNLTPDKLKSNDKNELFKICDECLRNIIKIIEPEYLIGIGNFAEIRAKESLLNSGINIKILKILHPSPASPLSAKDWPGKVTKQLIDAGIWR